MASFDLTTLAQVQAQAVIPAGDTGLVSALITALSRYVINFTGRKGLNQVLSVTDVLDGSGSDKQFLNEFPIQAVASVSIFGVAVQASPDGISAGYINDLNSVILLPGTSWGFGSLGQYKARFPRGRRNITVAYTAGYGPATDPPGNSIFNGAPDDLGQAVTELVVQQYKRRDWVDQASKTLAATGEVTVFRNWDWPPWIEAVMQEYKQPWPI